MSLVEEAPASKIERQELYCHACGRYVQFDMDLSLNGNHVLECPNCGHEHCRVVENGRIMGDRWDRRNQVYYVTGACLSTTLVSTFRTSTAGDFYLYDLWLTAASGT